MVSLKMEFCSCIRQGVSRVANFIPAYGESQYKQDSYFLSVMFSLFPKETFQIFN